MVLDLHLDLLSREPEGAGEPIIEGRIARFRHLFLTTGRPTGKTGPTVQWAILPDDFRPISALRPSVAVPIEDVPGVVVVGDDDWAACHRHYARDAFAHNRGAS